MKTTDTHGIALVGFDGDDTLWRSEDYFDEAQCEFEAIVGAYVDLGDARARERLYAIEKGNLALFGYGVKGMALSMIEAAVDITGSRIGADALHRIVELAKRMLQHPVELLPGIREAVEEIAAAHPVVLITKGDLFHQEAKVRRSGLADLFGRIEIVSEKDPATYARVLGEFDLAPGRFVMIGNSLRSDVAPVLQLGGWAVHMPYHLTWEHEREVRLGDDLERMREVGAPAELPAAVRDIANASAGAGAPLANARA
ncbi:HAD family hydrolase [Luteimonas sp. RD2P54]|uniref:HAD family hydrolase n=1 Tax=Luteimonas endophytica TaxID=3042023 RepID=A0ABT6JA58_9GAMM|nr:HAD family hydrolase [Luteimonas endophytica]MDH5823078.1 HAD family hydrolase [Luteimonas endophytica]